MKLCHSKYLGSLALALMIACAPSDDDDDSAGGNDGGPSADAASPVCSPGATESCYDGPAVTEGVGPCVGGTRTCAQDGLSWSACEGQVLPMGVEVCDNGVDDDCNGTPDDVVDIDGDGFTFCQGDCCETTAVCGEPTKVNPAAQEAPTADGGIPVDDDCDGMVDEIDPGCDTGLALDSADPLDSARAIGLCNPAHLLGAAFVRANGDVTTASLQTGILDGFGPNVTPREGTSLAALSSGHARRPIDPDPCGSLTCTTSGSGTPPPGFPQDVPGCAGGTDINDDAALELTLKAPANATGYSVDFSFYSFEYPEWVCTTFNDQFIILADPAPPGAINGNIAFDSMTNPVSVNIAFFQVCSGCPLGTAELQGTGFDVWDDAGATGWLQTQAPVTAGEELTLRLAIWDTGDQAWDSTVILDNFQWIVEGSPGVETNPIP